MIFRNLMITLLLAMGAAQASATDYNSLYEGTPIDLKKVSAPTIPSRRVSIEEFGAVGDGQTLCTSAFAEAIVDLVRTGGGHIDVPRGIWLTGPIVLDSNIDLHLESGAILLFSPDKNLFRIRDKAGKLKGGAAGRCYPAISAKDKKNISITGEGTIDGNGKFWRPVKRGKVSDVEWKAYKQLGGTVSAKGDVWYPYPLKQGDPADSLKKAEDSEKLRADLIRMERCENLLFEGVTIQNSPRFHLHPVNSKNVIIDGVTVRCPWNAQNGDAIDLSNVQTALIVNTIVDAGDDGLCMKAGIGQSGVDDGPVSDVLIQDSKVYHAHGGFVLGSDCSGGMQRIVVRRCLFSGTDSGLRFKSGMGRGGATSDIFISDIVMNDISGEAIVFENTYVNRQVGQKEDGKIHSSFAPDFKDIRMENVTCSGCKTGIEITGIQEAPVHDITLKNVKISGAKTPTNIVFANNLNYDGVTINGKQIK